VHGGVRAPERADELRAAIEALPDGVEVEILRIDVDDDASVEQAIASVLERDGAIDVLVNNAGVSGSGPVEEVPLDEFRRQMETNFFGVLRCTQAVVPSMRERRSGAIVQISSLAGRFIRASMGAYSATKHAVEAMSEALAQELAPFGVRVVLIEPGVIATPIWTKSAAPTADSAYPLAAATAITYFGRMLRDPAPPEEVAATILDALRTDDFRLRWPVGWDAQALIAARPSVSDESLIAMSALDVDEWKAAWFDAFGVSLD
jgi:NAD(P)-dependent dehydrogenase (short-subunit alcohol dehydrogenase family)